MFPTQPDIHSKKAVTRRGFAVLIALLFLSASPALAADFQVVVHPTNANDALTRDQVERMFLKRLTKWDNGVVVSPVDQPQSSAPRVAFTKAVHRKTVGAVVSYWQQQIFAGRGIPPAEMANDAAVLAFVAANPGAIGYITGTATATGVKVVAIR